MNMIFFLHTHSISLEGFEALDVRLLFPDFHFSYQILMISCQHSVGEKE